jgi:molecular chaperone DnaJ
MDFYVILGLERGATAGDIKRAYRRLARKYHPDINPGDRMAAAQFREIAEAYETLIDPDRRRHYDLGGAARSERAFEPGTVGFEGFDFSVSVSGEAAPTFGDLFADLFRRDAHASAPHRGADLHAALSLSFDDAVHGGHHQLTVSRQEHCRSCRGTGRLKTAETRCGSCHGSGVLKSARGHMLFSKPCAHCRGTGRLADTRCLACGGQQTAMRTDTLAVNVPPGLADGARIRVPGRGHAGRDGGEYGDLFVTVHVEPHPLFRREGDDLHLSVALGVHEAALGAKIEVPGLDGQARLRVPPGTQSGQRFRLRERGMPSPRTGRPRTLDERSKELLREFGKINPAGDLRPAPESRRAANPRADAAGTGDRDRPAAHEARER